MKHTQAIACKAMPILKVKALPIFVWKEPAAREAMKRNTE
jgi:hypothetical protein